MIKLPSQPQVAFKCLAYPLMYSNKYQPFQLPLSKIIYDVQIINGIVEVQLTQSYINKSANFLQLRYHFPINPYCCIHKFSAIFSKTRMEGEVKRKDISQEKFKQAVSEGKRAAMGQLKKSDVFVLSIGNIGPNEEVRIEISFTEELALSMNSFYLFNLSANDTSFFSTLSKQDLNSSYKKQVAISTGAEFEWEFNLKVRASRKILSYKSLTHQLIMQRSNDSGTQMAFTLSKESSLDKSFSFIYTTTDFELPSYSLGRSDVGSSVMISFIPKFCSLNIEDAQLQALQGGKYESDMDTAKGEYIFLLDRSGSMGGQPIKKAKEALILFLKSLPIDTYFQVVSFGSSYQKLLPVSEKNGDKSISEAIKKIEKMYATLGGTQIYEPLEDIFSSKIIQGYPKQIFLLTDGEVSNVDKVVNLIERNTRYARAHTIGFGSSASRTLITECAAKGKGSHIFIQNKEDPSDKIIKLLNDSITPVISNVTLLYDKEIVESIIPNPEKIPYILKGDVANFYVIMKGHLSQPTTISLTYIDSHNKLPFKSSVEIQPDSPSEAFIEKLANFKRIRSLQEADENNISQSLYSVKAIDKVKEIIDLSVKHQIISQHTSFICVEKELIDGRYEQVKGTGRLAVEISSVDRPKDLPLPPIHVPLMSNHSLTSGNLFQNASIHSTANPLSLFGARGRGRPQIHIQSLSSGSSTNLQRPLEYLSKTYHSASMDHMQPLYKQSYAFSRVYDQQCCQEMIQSGLSASDEEAGEDQIFSAVEGQRPKYRQINNVKKSKLAAKTAKKNQSTQQVMSVRKKTESQRQSKTQSIISAKDIVKQQFFEGYWTNQAIIQQLYGSLLVDMIKETSNKNAVITYLIVIWIEKHHPQKQYTMIVKKARNWLKKQEGYEKFASLYDAYLI